MCKTERMRAGRGCLARVLGSGKVSTAQTEKWRRSLVKPNTKAQLCSADFIDPRAAVSSCRR